MNANLWFWTGALVNMGLIIGLVGTGVRQARRRDFIAHRRSMISAGALVVAFLLAYVVKVQLLGGEALDTWSSGARTNLYVHEAFVATMLVASGFALATGRRLQRTRYVTGDEVDPPPEPGQNARHRLAGRIAGICAAMGFLTACGILAGMIARA